MFYCYSIIIFGAKIIIIFESPKKNTKILSKNNNFLVNHANLGGISESRLSHLTSEYHENKEPQHPISLGVAVLFIKQNVALQ